MTEIFIFAVCNVQTFINIEHASRSLPMNKCIDVEAGTMRTWLTLYLFKHRGERRTEGAQGTWRVSVLTSGWKYVLGPEENLIEFLPPLTAYTHARTHNLQINNKSIHRHTIAISKNTITRSSRSHTHACTISRNPFAKIIAQLKSNHTHIRTAAGMIRAGCVWLSSGCGVSASQRPPNVNEMKGSQMASALRKRGTERGPGISWLRGTLTFVSTSL